MTDKREWQRLSNEAWFAKRRGDFRAAERLLLAAIHEVSSNQEDRAELCLTLNTLADLYANYGEISEAIRIAKSIVETRRIMPISYRNLLGSDLMFLAMALNDAGQVAEAVRAAEEGVHIYSDLMGCQHSETLRMGAFLAEAKRKLTGTRACRRKSRIAAACYVTKSARSTSIALLLQSMLNDTTNKRSTMDFTHSVQGVFACR